MLQHIPHGDDIESRLPANDLLQPAFGCKIPDPAGNAELVPNVAYRFPSHVQAMGLKALLGGGLQKGAVRTADVKQPRTWW